MNEDYYDRYYRNGGYRSGREFLIDRFEDYLAGLGFGLWKLIAIIIGYPLVIAVEAVCGTVKVCLMITLGILTLGLIFQNGPARPPRR